MLLNMEFSMCHLYDFKHTGILQLRIKNSKLKKKTILIILYKLLTYQTRIECKNFKTCIRYNINVYIFNICTGQMHNNNSIKSLQSIQNSLRESEKR